MQFKQSAVSAHHNYLVNDLLTPGFVLGNPEREGGFWFLADVVPPGTSTPRISGRLFDMNGDFLLEFAANEIVLNPGGCNCQAGPSGLRLSYASGEPLLGVHTQVFANGYLTRIQGKLFDETGTLRMEPSYDGVQVYGDARLSLNEPLRPFVEMMHG